MDMVWYMVILWGFLFGIGFHVAGWLVGKVSSKL